MSALAGFLIVFAGFVVIGGFLGVACVIVGARSDDQ